MSEKEDAAPFLVLQSEAEKFKNIFDSDIKNCIIVLNSKITSLICEPEFCANPFGEPKRTMSTARMEFSKAKYEIFSSITTLFKDMENSWTNEISNMKDTFLESLEIFLAGTKLEVKFPSQTEISHLAVRKTPENLCNAKERKSPNSIYPSLHHLEDNYAYVKRDRLRRKPFYDLDELPSSPALNLSPLKQNLCDIEEEEINNMNESTTEFIAMPQELSEKISLRKTRTKAVPAVVIQDLHASMVQGQDYIIEKSTKTHARRKTMHCRLEDTDLPEMTSTPERVTRTKSKRKTICALTEDFSEALAAPSPKRVKRSGSLKTQKSRAVAYSTPEKNFALMECDEGAADKTFSATPGKHGYTSWVPLQSMIDLPPKTTGVYELKVWRAKKSAFIGCCEDLLQQLSLHKEHRNSGRKQLDKFLERNMNDIQVRYEVLPTIVEARVEVKNRIKTFVDQYKTTPAYN